MEITWAISPPRPDPLADFGKGLDDVPGEGGADEEVFYLRLEAGQLGLGASQFVGVVAQVLLGHRVGGAQLAAAVVVKLAQFKIGLGFG